jgi:DNA (cytosine-5)-methyltransferase 1
MLTYSDLMNEINSHFNETEKAYITHAIHNIGFSSNDFYKNDTIKFLNNHRSLNIFSFLAEKIINEEPILPKSDEIEIDFNFIPPDNPIFTFIDLFAGIGGFRIAFQKLGGRCLFSSEIDKYSQKTYELNFGESPFGDITKITNVKMSIPPHDILLAGFPCQAFSIAGRKMGFEDTRGTLFFDIARILREIQPKAFLLENVKGLTNHNKGKTLRTILEVLRKDLDYFIPDPEILDARNFGVAQKRERIFIVGFHKDTKITSFYYPKPSKKNITLNNVIEDKPVSVKYYLSQQYLNTLRNHKKRHEDKGNGFGYEIKKENDIANAIVVGGMGKERNLIIDKRLKDFTPVTKIKGKVNGEYVRRMTPKEWLKLQGFPNDYHWNVSDAQAYKQFGNAVAVSVVESIGKNVINHLFNNTESKQNLQKGEENKI